MEEITDPTLLEALNGGSSSSKMQEVTDPELLKALEGDITGPSKVESALRGAAQGVSFGFADEIAAGLESAFTPKTYEQAVMESRNNYSKAQGANPMSYLAGDVVGSIAPIVASGGLGTAGLAARGVGTAARLAASGAAAGGLRGAGDAETMADVPVEALKGAAVGGAIGLGGAGVGTAGRGLTAVSDNVTSPLIGKVAQVGGDLPVVGERITAAGDKFERAVQSFIDKGYAPNIARGMAGKVVGYGKAAAAGHAIDPFIPGSSAVVHGINATDAALAGSGKILQSVNGKIGPNGIATATSLVTSDVPDGEPVAGNVSVSQALQVSRGTPYELELQQAMSRGSEATKAKLFQLTQDPGFRKLLR